MNYTTGGNKNEINGFKIDFTAKEERGSFFLNDLSNFIIGESFLILLQNNDFFTLQNNDKTITQNG